MTEADRVRASEPHPLTASVLVGDLRELGVRDGGTVMFHTRMSALGWVIGGSETVIRSLLEVVGPRGTLAAFAAWDDHPYHLPDWPKERRRAYLADPPIFDARTAEADRDHGRLPERLRTWPGAQRSAHPEASVVAVGACAGLLTVDHPQQDGFGPDSPFGRLVAADGQVLMLGAPLETLTLLHHAEAIAQSAAKRFATFSVPIREDGRVVERVYHEIETTRGAFPYSQLDLGEDEFATIAREALSAGAGVQGRVGAAVCALFEAKPLVSFAVNWLESRFG